MTLLLNHRGEPEAPVAVIQRLRELSPRLGIKWVTGVAGAYFALTEVWPPGDARWQRVNTGEIAESDARDILTMFPSNVRGEDMVAWVEQRWGPRANAGVTAEEIVADAKQRRADETERFVQKGHDIAEQGEKGMNRRKRELAAGVGTASPMLPGGLTA